MLHTNQVLSFFRPRESGGDWSQRELAEFYRVEGALVNSGVAIATDRGLTDEGDPWFVFCREDNGEVIVHFARIDGEYVIVSNLTEGAVRGKNFSALVGELLESHPHVLPKANSRRQTVYLHPATLLAALIVTGYIKSAEPNGGSDDAGQGSEKSSGWFFNRHDLAAFSAFVIATVWDHLHEDSNAHKFNLLAWFDDAKADPDAVASSIPPHNAYDNPHLNDLAFKGPQDHVLDTSHLAAASVFGLETADAATKGNDGWAANLPEQLKGLGYQGVTTHSNDGDLFAGSHDAWRAQSDGEGKSLVWHSDTDSTEPPAINGQAGPVVAATKPENSVNETASVATDSHGSSTPPAVQTASFAISPTASTASSAACDALHIDPLILHPVALAATNLTDAVQSTLQQLNQESSSTGASTDPLSNSVNLTAAPAAGNAAQSPATTVSFAPVQTFDIVAQHDLQNFIDHTPNYRIESFGHDLLIVDTNASHYASSTVETWTMADGSTLSIVGQAAHVPTHLAA